MHFESLEQALDEGDPNLTIEGHPAPVRAIVIAKN
jgi:tRNA (mo5U34)-methyltransferase